MTNKNTLSKLMVPIAVFGGAVAVAAVARAVSHNKFRKNNAATDDLIETDKKTLPGLILFEFKTLFDFNRFD